MKFKIKRYNREKSWFDTFEVQQVPHMSVLEALFQIQDELDSSLGKPGDLAQLRSRLNGLGLGLILDFIPNHVALDHPWTLTHPGRFIQVTEADVMASPDAFFKADGGACLAHGRDPNFPPWTVKAVSPAESKFATAASIAPVPEEANINTSFFVWNTYFKPSLTSFNTA